MSHYKPYPAYKDSGVEWLGRVPEHWRVSRLRHNIFSPLAYGANESGESENPDDPRFIRITDLNGDGSLREDTFKSLSRDLAAPYMLKNGDVLLARSGATVGKSFIYRSNLGPACYAGYLIRARLTPNKCTPEYFKYCTESNYYWDFIAGSNIQSTIQNVSGEKYMNLWLATPSRLEQTEISRFLDSEIKRIDGLTSKKTSFIELLREKRQALITHAVTKGLDPAAKMKDSGVEWLGEIPAHWSLIPFKSCIHYQEGPGIMAADFREEGVPLLRVSCVQGRWASLDGCNYLDPNKVKKTWSHFQLEEGDLLISASASMGTISEITENTVGCIAYTGLIRLRPVIGVMIKSYIRALISSSLFKTQIELFKTGSTIQHFGPIHLSQMVAVCPPIDEQGTISAHIDRETTRLDTLITKTELSLTLLKERRSALITAAVTGQIDLRKAS